MKVIGDSSALIKGAQLSDLSPEELHKIPKRTLMELAAPVGKGERHFQIKRIAIPMLADGFSPERVFALLRERYDSDLPDQEISDIIQWAISQGFQPSASSAYLPARKPLTPHLSPEQKQDNAEKFLKGFRCSVDDLISRSPEKLYGEPRDRACLFLWHAYSLADLLNIVTDFTIDESGKALPKGRGQTKSVYQWRHSFCVEESVPQSDAGCWFRLNPVRPANIEQGYPHWQGSGLGGAYTDADIERFSYVLVESDCLPLDIQASLLARLPLFISSIVDSGGKSLQARVLLERGFEEARAILRMLYPYGFDRSNGNASRLSRFPGAIRKLKSRDEQGTEQRLVYLSPTAKGPIV
jgi:hypothetical protein